MSDIVKDYLSKNNNIYVYVNRDGFVGTDKPRHRIRQSTNPELVVKPEALRHASLRRML